MSSSIVIAAADTTNVKPTSITPAWILAGKPENRAKQLALSKDRNSYTMVWDCTAGSFDWHYNLDETLVVLEGEAYISFDGAAERRIGPSDVVFFPGGCSATWRVPNYIRKVAFLRHPIPPPGGFCVRAWNALLRVVLRRQGGGL